MEILNTGECEDIELASKEERPVRKFGPYRLMIGNERLEYKPTVIADPIVTGQQLLDLAGVQPAIEYEVFQVLRNGLLESIRPDETLDLCTGSVEKFLIFRNDRSFRFELNGRIFEWGGTFVSGQTLKKLAAVDPCHYDVWLVIPNAENRLIDDREMLDLSSPGVERLVVIFRKIDIFVNGRIRSVESETLSYNELIDIAYPGAPTTNDRVYTVSYKYGPACNPEGKMVEGDTVYLKEGMKFYVSSTNRS